MSVEKSEHHEILEAAIAEVNLIDRALAKFPQDANMHTSLARLIADLRREHQALTEALELHATKKRNLSQGALGSLGAVLGTIPSWIKATAILRNTKNMLNNLGKRASAHKHLVEAIDELRRATQPTRASLSAYNEIRESEGQTQANSGGLSRDDAPALTAAQATTNTRYHALQGTNASSPPHIGGSYLQDPRATTRIAFERGRSHLSDLAAQYLESVEEVPNPTYRRSTDIPPPEPEPPYIPPNALSPPPRRQPYTDFSLSQGIESPPPQTEREHGVRSSHTRGLSDLSAFNNANRSTSTFSSQGYADSLSPGYSSGSDLPSQIRAGGSIGGDSWGSSERLGGTGIVGNTAGYQSETSSLEVPPPSTSQNSERSEGQQGGQWTA